MESLEKNYAEYLPMNRKERFFTATILPQIICHENFKHLNLFLKLIDNFPYNMAIKPDTADNNIQFITEYSIKESANYSGKKFENLPKTKDTPDLVILITTPEPHLIVIEGKMFSTSSIGSFKKQIQAQKEVIECIQKNLSIDPDKTYHIGLVPKQYFSEKNISNCQMLSWEEISMAYKDILKGNYFFETLQLALKNYKQLISKSEDSYGKNSDAKLTGLEILRRFNAGEVFLIGRSKGLNGAKLSVDKISGKWKTQKYEVNFTREFPPNTNWFKVEEFVEFMEV